MLTAELARRADKVVCIEIDSRLLPILDETLAEFDNIKIVNEDVLKVDLHKLIGEEFAGMPVAVCANLPYYITSPIIMSLLEARLPIVSLTVMVQKEAAQRLCAAPGSRLDVRQQPPVQLKKEEDFFRVVKAAFSQRRKTLPNTLSAGLAIPKQQALDLLERAGVASNLRAEQLSMQQFADIANAL